jgi:rod shape-determining protein MreC
LQGLSIYFIVSYSKYHQAAFGNTTNKFTGAINKQYNKVEYYFQLSRTNDSLVKANEMLYNKLRSNYNLPDSGNRETVDSIRVDSIVSYKKITYLSAKVISNSVSLQNNFIVINGPNVKNFTVNMGVVDVNNSVVGKIIAVEGDYAVVMSLLHKDSKLNGKLFKGEQESGIVLWNGEKPNILALTNIAKSATVAVGDSVVTNISNFFPKGLLIGRVVSVKPETVNNNFKIVLKSAVNFNSIEYVYAIKNKDAEPVNNILDKVKASNN